MKKRFTLATGFLACLLAAPAMAGQSDIVLTPPAPAQEQPAADGAGAESTVPQAQLELMQKREEARQRRDELMKIRAENIEAADRGSELQQTVK